MQRVLLIGSETMSRIVDWEDRSTAILFGDGAGAVVLEQGDGPGPGPRLGPRLRRLAAPPPPRRRRRHDRDGRPRGVPAGRADHGRLRRAGARPRRASTVDDVTLFVPHQANSRIITSARAKLGIPEERTADILATTGNTSAASIPMALADAADAGRLQPGRHRAPHRLRRRHVLGLRRDRMGGMSEPTPARTVLVTGGSKGIGLGCARAFAAAGHRVAVTSSSTPVDEAGLLTVKCDVTDPDQVEAAVSQVEDQLGPVEVLVANAGITRDGLLVRMSEDDFETVRRHQPHRHLAARQARRAEDDEGPLGADHRRVVGRRLHRRARAVELRLVQGRPHRPGPVDRPRVRPAGHHRQRRGTRARSPPTCSTPMPEDKRAALGAQVPVGRIGTVEEVAAAVTFLASDPAAYITGAVVPVDGGLGMGF